MGDGVSRTARARRAGGMSLAMVAAAALTWWVGLGGAWTGPVSIEVPWLVVAAMFAASEGRVVHVHVGGDAHSFSLGEVPLVIGLFALHPGALVAAAVAGGAVAVGLVRRQTPLKVAFNVSHYALGATLAAALFHNLVPAGDPVSFGAWGATLVAVVPVAVLGAVLVECVIALCQGRVDAPRLGGVLGLAAVAAVASTSLGLAAVTLLAVEPAAIWMLAVPGATLFLAARAYLAERHQRERIEFLYEAGRLLTRSPDVQRALPEVLAHAGRTFRAGRAELVLFPRSANDAALRASWQVDGTLEPLAPLAADPGLMVAASMASDDGGLLLSADKGGAMLARQGYSDAVVVAVEGEGEPIGSLLIANRLGEVSHFNRDEVKLLETLAVQLGVALENGELARSVDGLREREGDLRRRALHDPLTGLGNRDLFGDRLEAALVRRTPAPLAVLFVDLDGFKDVNDSLGHAAGDEVLGEVADRIRSCLRPGDTAARLGGDEFALLVERVGSPSAAVAVAMRILDALRAPVSAAGQPVTLTASIGVALAAPGGTSSQELLHRADAAMYRAKRSGRGAVEVAPVPGQEPEREDCHSAGAEAGAGAGS
jgi:diguanylate cyclase (GGDEF)-like protein